MLWPRLLILGLLLISNFSARADVLVLVHGFAGSAMSWEESGVLPVLRQQGWKVAGILGPAEHWLPMARSQQAVYLLNLASAEHLNVQIHQAQHHLQQIQQRHPQQSLIIVGHSVGGVVARAALLNRSSLSVKALITIAAPHEGTPRASQGLDLAESPFPLSIPVAMLTGEYWPLLQHARPLLWELQPANVNSVLAQLNRSPHPNIAYYAVVRMNDEMVPPWSQNLGFLAMQGLQVKNINSAYGHGLMPEDGILIARIVENLS